jgi:hypothetical protein
VRGLTVIALQVKALNKPCVVEEIAPDMRVPKGYICSTVKQLMVRPLLGASIEVARIRPALGFCMALRASRCRMLWFDDAWNT